MRWFAIFMALPLMAAPARTPFKGVHIYVANSGGDTISIIDPEANRVVGEIKVSGQPHGLAASPDGERFYVSSEGQDVLDVVDRATSSMIRRIPLGKRPNNLAITPDGKRVYICIRNESWVDVVDTAALEKVKRIPVGLNPHNVYCTPDGKWMIATSMGDRKLTAINIRTEQPEFEIPLDGIPRPLAIEPGPDGSARRLFVQLSDLHGFVIVDFEARKATGRVLLPDAPADATPLIPHTFSHGIAVAPDRKTLWVTSLLSNCVSVYSLPDLKLMGAIPVGNGPDWMTFTPDGSRCYVSNAGAESVSAIDAATRHEIARIPVGRVPKRLIAAE